MSVGLGFVFVHFLALAFCVFFWFSLEYFVFVLFAFVVLGLVLLQFQNVSCRSVSVGFAEKTSIFGLV